MAPFSMGSYFDSLNGRDVKKHVGSALQPKLLKDFTYLPQDS